MKNSKQRQFASVLIMTIATSLLACGGGGNESGPPDSIVASPSSVTINGGPNSCAVGLGPTVFLYGGQPPYTLTNSAPQAMQLDVTQVQESGQGFTVRFINGICLDQIPITVEDGMGRVLPIPMTNKVGAGT